MAQSSKLDRAATAFWSAIYPRERWTPSEWAERAPRHIPDNGINPEPGPWKNDRTPYLAGILDAIVDPAVREVVFLKPTQVGYTEGVLVNLLGYAVDMDPGSALILMPDEQSAKELLDERVMPTFRETPCLSKHISGKAWDTKKESVKFDTMPVFMAWAGSPMRVASRAIRWLICDEIDKYPPFSGKEADPISLARKRVSNWGHRGKEVYGSTPTVRNGNIMRRWEMCGTKMHYWVPCPHCRRHQVLVWSRVKWPKYDEDDRAKKAELILSDHAAYYECEHCRGKIEDWHKPEMLTRGVWASEDQVVNADGEVRGPESKSSRVGFHLNGIYSPWLTFSQLASEFCLAQGDPTLLMDFLNSRLAEPFEQQIAKPDASKLRKTLETVTWRPGLVPKWAGILIATADTQKDHFWLRIRAWGHGFRSRGVFYGRVETFDDLYRLCFETPYQMDGGGVMMPMALLIDSGGTKAEGEEVSRTFEVYQFSQRDPGRIWPLKGASNKQHKPARLSQVTPKAPPGFGEMPPITLRLLDTDWYKDLLMSRIDSKPADDGSRIWELAGDEPDDYFRGMESERKIFDRKAGRSTWIKVSAGAQNHPWDVEAYQMAGADLCNVATIPPQSELDRVRADAVRREARQAAEQNERTRERGSGFTVHGHRGKY